MRPQQNGPHIADNIFNYIFLKRNFCISIQISLNLVPDGGIHAKKISIFFGNGLAPANHNPVH